MEVNANSSTECLEDSSDKTFDINSVKQAFYELLKIPVWEFQKALKKAFAILLQDIDLKCDDDLKHDKKDDFNDSFQILSLRQTFNFLFKVQIYEFHKSLINALIILAENVLLHLKSCQKETTSPFILNVFVFVMEIPMMQYIDYLEDVLPVFCKAASYLSVKSQAVLARIWCTCQPDCLREMLNVVHQLISHGVIQGWFRREYCLNNKDMIIGITKLMKIIFYASLLGGEVADEELKGKDNELIEKDKKQESLLGNNNLVKEDKVQETLLENKLGEKENDDNNELVEGDDQDEESSSNDIELVEDQELTDANNELVGRNQNESGLFLANADYEPGKNYELREDPLSVELNIKPINCLKPLLHFNEFYHELLSKHLEMDKDFAFVGNPLELSFILTPEVKALGLGYDNRVHMRSIRQLDGPDNSMLKLWVRRDHLIDDALVGLKMVAMESPTHFKKKLVVEFDGELGVDAGGVSKEFFQLIVQEIFNADFAMFTFNPETQTYWFNPTTFESEEQFVLIGIILGLAIYNNIILDVHFPMVVYRKLMGKKGTFHDLEDWNPSLWKGLNDLLAYTSDDLEDVFMQSYCITYKDVFGTLLTHNLKEGVDLLVNQGNKKEFVRLYSDFLLNKSISEQFEAFKKGFEMVTKDSLLYTLFRPEELEVIICGDKDFDFSALEKATKYDCGYWSDSPVIKWFWEIVHHLSLEQKRKLLQFTTGSDRVPVGGLSKLKMVIVRNGDDTDRLPTAHTCCNVLLLPEYATKEKLKDRLLKAIEYFKGFGLS